MAEDPGALLFPGAAGAGPGPGRSFLPPFANEENKALDAQIRELEAQLERAETALDENSDRISIMDEHLKNVQQELKYTQSKVETKAKETDSESHLKQLSERELGKLRKDLESMEKDKLELQDKINSLQQAILKGSEKMDQFKLLMNWNQEELEQWVLAQKQKEEDNLALEKYKRQDEAKVKELMLQVELLAKEVSGKKRDLEVEVSETQAAQVQLDKAADDFRNLHKERQDLIRQWDEAMAGMRQKDEAIQAATQLFADAKSELRKKHAEMDSLARFLENEKINNKELDARIAFQDREVAKQRDVLTREQKRVEECQHDVDLIKATLSRAANDLATATSSNAFSREDLGKQRGRLDAARKRYASLRRKLESEANELDTLELKVEELEGLRQQEDNHLKQVVKEAEALKKVYFKKSQELYELRQRERNLISEISGSQSQNRNLAVKITQLDEQVVKQQELLYNVQFQLQQMERKVARAQGARSEDESRALNARIEKLTTMLETVNASHAMLIEQVKTAEEHLLAARRQNNGLKSNKAQIDGNIATLQLETESIARQLRTAVEGKEKTLVDHDLLKLEVRRLRGLLNSHAGEVYSLENRKFQLKMSLEERRLEVDMYRKGLEAELKLLKEDVHRITLELKERSVRVERLQSKHDIISSKGGRDENGEPKSQAYYLIKAAQEREELQREGDELDAKISKAEKEVQALENTLLQLMGVNSAYTQNFKKADNAASASERVEIRDKLDKAYDKLKFLRAEEASTVGDLQVVQQRLGNLQAEQQHLQLVVSDLQMRKAEIQQQADDQAAKADRAKRVVQRAQRLLRGKLGLEASSEVSEQELDLQLADIREVNRHMLQELASLAGQHPGVAEAVEAAGLKLPTGSSPSASRAGSLAGSRQGSRAPSVASSTASLKSATSGRSRPGSSTGIAAGRAGGGSVAFRAMQPNF